MLKRRTDVLLVGAPPPPVHGQAVVTGLVFDTDYGKLLVERIEARFSRDIDKVGRAGGAKIWVMCVVVWKLLKARLRSRPRVLYYTAGSGNWTPLLRDAMILGTAGKLFRTRVVHFHSGGIPEFIRGRRLARFLAWLAYGGSRFSVGLSAAVPVPVFAGTELRIVPNGLDVAPPGGDSVAQRGPGSALRCLFVGSLHATKGVDTILDAAEILVGRGVAFEINFVGEWNDEGFRDATRSRLAKSAAGGRVRFAGRLVGAEKARAFADADVFVFPTRYESENQPLVIIEALAAGLPVVASRWRGVPEMVRHDGEGRLVEPDDPRGLADELQALAAEPGQRRQLGAAARQRYESTFSLSAFEDRMRALFAEALAARA